MLANLVTLVILGILAVCGAGLWWLLWRAPLPMKRRRLNLMIAIDQLTYVLLTLGHGSPDETMSAAAYRLWLRDRIGGRWFKPLIDALFWLLERDHCKKSYRAEMERRHLPGGYTR